jgi:hypothetical protein
MFTYQLFDFADPPLVKAQPKPEETEDDSESPDEITPADFIQDISSGAMT